MKKNIGAFSGKRQGDSPSNTLCPACHERGFSLNLHRTILPVFMGILYKFHVKFMNVQ